MAEKRKKLNMRLVTLVNLNHYSQQQKRKLRRKCGNRKIFGQPKSAPKPGLPMMRGLRVSDAVSEGIPLLSVLKNIFSLFSIA